ncbi:MAG: PQQ-binding-like beta-propeller repeat protein [bacterium]
MVKSQHISLVIIFLSVLLFFPYATLAVDGELDWRFETGGDIYSSPAISSDGTIYCGSFDGKLYALNPNGTLKWEATTNDSIENSSPAIGSDGTIYVGSTDGYLYAFDPNGTLNWRYSTGGEIHSSPAIGTDGTIYVGSCDKKLHAIYSNGNARWSYPTGAAVYSSPAIGSDGTIYVGSYDNKLYAIHPDSSLKWSYSTGGHIKYSSPAIGSDGTIYIASDDHNLYAINPDGSMKWRYATGDNGFSSAVIGSDGTIYIGSQDKKILAMNPDGSLKWRYVTENWIYPSPAIGSDGTIYFGSNDGNLYAINPDGSLKWNYATEGAIYTSSPVIGNDGTIYIGSRDHHLYAIEGSGVLANTPWPMFHHNSLHTGKAVCKPSNPPEKPVLSSPENASTGLSLTPDLMTAGFSDPDDDTHLHTRWQISMDHNFPSTVLHLTSTSHLTSLKVPKLTLTGGTTYYWRVQFYDHHSAVSEWSDIYSFTTSVATNDQNSNGIPDDQENDTVDLDNDGMADANQYHIKSLNTIIGNCQMGISIKGSKTVSSIEFIESIDPEIISLYFRPDTPLGLFGFRITLTTPGDEAEVTVYFCDPAPEDEENKVWTWYLYNSIYEWIDYKGKKHATFSQDRRSITLTLKDGGYGDADGIANGIIVDPGAFGLASWIEGSVHDSDTNEPIPYANVKIENQPLHTISENNYFSMILPGTYTMTVSADGYETKTERIEICEGGITSVDFALLRDNCPDDPYKVEPGECGCGIADIDTDEDGTLDCNDSCPHDPEKAIPGICGCGVPDIDSDNDGTLDCIDNCPNDPSKTEPGICGCGTPDSDNDGDGVLNCNDNCLNIYNPDQLNSDNDEAGDACDGCPNDPYKTEPGIYGCGTLDTDNDGDGIVDYSDNCPHNSNPEQLDADGDGKGDACDDCPNDPNKISPGICGCGLPDIDSDSDTICDPVDNCQTIYNPEQQDDDADGIGNACDGCPNDPQKIMPGICDCGVPDIDSDNDGLFDCQDNCPTIYNPNQPDGDKDGIGDMCDDCTDTDGDGYGNPGYAQNTCQIDNCPNKNNPEQLDTDSDGYGDACDECPHDPYKISPGECGCGIVACKPLLPSDLERQVIEIIDQNCPIKGLMINIPPGALTTECTITAGIAHDPPPFPDGIELIGEVIDLGPEGINFNPTIPVVIKFPYNDNDRSILPEILAVYTYNEDKWQKITIDAIDRENCVLICKLTHFSLYAIGKSTPPPSPPVNNGGSGSCFIHITAKAALYPKHRNSYSPFSINLTRFIENCKKIFK